MIYKKLATLAAATVIGATLMTAPAEARFGGGGMRGGFGGVGFRGGGSFGVAHVGGFSGFRGGGFRGEFVRGPGFVGRSAFVNRGFFPGRRFAFFPRRRFMAPFFGVGALYGAAYSSCWTWVPTAYGWRQVWTCDSNYGYY